MREAVGRFLRGFSCPPAPCTASLQPTRRLSFSSPCLPGLNEVDCPEPWSCRHRLSDRGALQGPGDQGSVKEEGGGKKTHLATYGQIQAPCAAGVELFERWARGRGTGALPSPKHRLCLCLTPSASNTDSLAEGLGLLRVPSSDL